MSPGSRSAGSGRWYLLATVLLVVAALAGGELLLDAASQPAAEPGSDPTPATGAPVLGASVLGLFYVLAQGVERVVELLIALVHRLPGEFAETVKRRALAGLAEGTAGARELVEQARRDLGVLGQGLSFAVAYLAVCAFDTGLFAVSGLFGTGAPSAFEARLDLLLTAVAVTGGSKSLHDVLAKVEKSKERSEARGARVT